MTKNEVKVVLFDDFFEKIKLDTVSLKALIEETVKKNELKKEYTKQLENELSLLKEPMFSLNKNFPLTSSLLIKKEAQRYIEKNFKDLTDFDNKTDKLKKLEKQLKKDSSNSALIKEVALIKVSRDIEKLKYNELIKSRNELNKAIKIHMKKEGFIEL